MYFILISIIAITTQKLKIIEPIQLRHDLGNEIKYSVASFGKIPWGHRMLGNLDRAIPELACDKLPFNSKQSEFLLVRRGECTFVTKVKNAQDAGYKLVIIGDNLQDELTSNFTMADDGNGFQISIPSIFIGKKDADSLMEFASNSNDETKSVLLLMKFDVKQRLNVEIVFALDIENLESFRIMDDFKEYYTKLKDTSIHYTLMYHMYQISAEQQSDDCLCSGKYCAFMSERKEFGSGKDIVRETQRQLCLFNIDPEGFFLYLNSFRTQCTAPISYDICSIKIMKELKLEYDEVLNCFQDSFLDPFTNQTTQNFSNAYNPQLEQQIRLNLFLGIQTFPSIMINDQFFLGELSGKAVFGDICNGFLSPPNICLEEVDGQIISDQSNESAQLVNLIVILLSILIIFGAVGFIICRKFFKTNEKETEQYVNEMVNQYIQFSEAKNTQQKNQNSY